MILLVMGVSGSGKTTIAQALSDRLGWTFADGDDFHSADARAKMHAGIPLTDADRIPWLERIAAWITSRHAEGKDAVIACSALRRTYRNILTSAAPDTRIIYLKGSPELIASRLRHRAGHFMPPSLLSSQFETLQEPEPDEAAIKVDVDGTVASIVDAILDRLGRPERGAAPVS